MIDPKTLKLETIAIAAGIVMAVGATAVLTLIKILPILATGPIVLLPEEIEAAEQRPLFQQQGEGVSQAIRAQPSDTTSALSPQAPPGAPSAAPQMPSPSEMRALGGSNPPDDFSRADIPAELVPLSLAVPAPVAAPEPQPQQDGAAKAAAPALAVAAAEPIAAPLAVDEKKLEPEAEPTPPEATSEAPAEPSPTATPLIAEAVIPTPKAQAAPPEEPTPIPQRLVITYEASAPGSADRAAALAQILKKAGYGDAELRTVGFVVSRNQIKFFHAPDEAGARAVLKAAGALDGAAGEAAFAVHDFTHQKPAPENGLIEIWLRSW